MQKRCCYDKRYCMGKQFKTSFFSRRLWVSVFFFPVWTTSECRSIRKEKKRKGEKFRTAFSCVDCHVDTKSGRNQNA